MAVQFSPAARTMAQFLLELVSVIGLLLGLVTREAVPRIRRVAVLSNPGTPSQPLMVDSVKGTARSLGLQLQLVDARGTAQFDGAFAAMARERVAAIFVVSEAMFLLNGARLAALEARTKLPSEAAVLTDGRSVLKGYDGFSLPRRQPE